MLASPQRPPRDVGREGEPPEQRENHDKTPRPGLRRHATRDHGPGGRRAGTASDRPSQTADRPQGRRENAVRARGRTPTWRCKVQWVVLAPSGVVVLDHAPLKNRHSASRVAVEPRHAREQLAGERWGKWPSARERGSIKSHASCRLVDFHNDLLVGVTRIRNRKASERSAQIAHGDWFSCCRASSAGRVGATDGSLVSFHVCTAPAVLW